MCKKVPFGLEEDDDAWFWIKGWSKKEETCWEICLDNMVAEWMELCGDLSDQAWISGRCLEC